MQDMIEPVVKVIDEPKLENPIFVEGLPGFGNVGEIAAKLLIDFSDAKLFAELYSPSFFDYAIVDKNGLCRLPRYEFYASENEKSHFIILTGDMQPPPDDLPAHYEVCDLIMEYVLKFNCKLVVSLGGMPVPQAEDSVYVASTSKKLLNVLKEVGGIVYRRGRIVGATGLLPALAKVRGLNGVCLLGATTRPSGDGEAGFRVFKFLLRLINALYEGRNTNSQSY